MGDEAEQNGKAVDFGVQTHAMQKPQTWVFKHTAARSVGGRESLLLRLYVPALAFCLSNPMVNDDDHRISMINRSLFVRV